MLGVEDLEKRQEGERLENGTICFTERVVMESSSDEDDDYDVVRTKRFPLKPMAVEEAILQMNLLTHSFFVFINADTETVNVVYRRKDGKYGLIEPEF